MIIFKLGEILARYKVTGAALARELGVERATVSRWKNDKQLPSLGSVDSVLAAIVKLGNKRQLNAHPLTIATALEWRIEQDSVDSK